MKVFSYEKYLAWCKESGQPDYGWSESCDGQMVDEKGMVRSKPDGALCLSDEIWETEI